VRITVQLVDVASDRSVWARSYDRGLTDILALQSEVARAIADEIRIQVTPDERARLGHRSAVDPAAHVAYLQGLFLWNRFTGETVKQAIQRYQEALAIDPNYAAAYAGLADSYIMLANHHILPPCEGYSLGRKAAEQGLSRDESLAELHTSLGWIHRLFDWDWATAERESLRAIQLNPGYAFGHSRYALLLSGLGRHEEAIAEAQRAHELDPLNLLTYTAVGDTLFYARRFESSLTLIGSVSTWIRPLERGTPTSHAPWSNWDGPTRQSWSLYGELPVPMACPGPPPAWRFFTRAMGGLTMPTPPCKQFSRCRKSSLCPLWNRLVLCRHRGK
jgi:tetratricopeptide (TPR) repeat protein